MNLLQDAAKRMLENLPDAATGFDDLLVERLTCDVHTGSETQLVTLRMLDGRLQTACTCARTPCLHVRKALQLVAATGRASVRPERISVELRALPERTQLQAHALANDVFALCEPLADVVTAVVRSGVATDRVASVHETLSRVERALPPPLPLGLLRWLGRMREALDYQDVALVAHALSAATTMASDLRRLSGQEGSHEARDGRLASGPAASGARARLVSWLGAGARGDAARPASWEELTRLSDRRMLEIAREWVTGTERHQIERRYLIDLDSGEQFREECVRRNGMSSLGPCPRSIGVGLAEVELGRTPRRLRLLQYTTTPEIERETWEALAGFAERDTEVLTRHFAAELHELGALAEPFALIAPQALQFSSTPKVVCERGAPLPLSAEDEPGVLRRLEDLCNGRVIAWVAGRLLQRGGQVQLRPLAVGLSDVAGIRHERL